jgi:hypothetical protein
MNAIKATWTRGRIVPAEPVDWPEGSELLVEPLAVARDKIGLEEGEWRDDAGSQADWDAWLSTVEPLVLSAEERVALARYRDEFRKYNLEAVRRQMAAGEGS